MNHIVRSLCVLGAVGLIGTGLWLSKDLSDARWLLFLFAAWVLLIAGTRVPLPAGMTTFNRSLIRTALAISTVFILISAQLVRIQVIERDVIFYRSGADSHGETISNPRLVYQTMDTERGRIYDRHGTVIADTTRQDGEWVRSWPAPACYSVTGFYSPGLYGPSGLENSYDDVLSGSGGPASGTDVVKHLLGMPTAGSNLNLTVDANLQSNAMSYLGNQHGAVVVLDVKTGATLVLASNPTIDPNRLFTTGDSSGAQAYYAEVTSGSSSILVPRAYLGLYTPGSTFKTVTAGIAIENGYAGPQSPFEDNGVLYINGQQLIEQNRPDESRTQWTMSDGIAWSLNVVFAQIGMKVGGPTFWNEGAKYGFGVPIPYDIPVSQSQIASDRSDMDNLNTIAATGFGQGELLMSPLHLAMLSSMWANEGIMMRPYLVQSITDADGETVWTARPVMWKQPVSGSTAGQVRDMMINAVEHGSVARAVVDGYVVGGKTGTAELGDGTAHSLFIGFIGDPEPRYAVAVVLERGYGGTANAAQIGGSILADTIRTDSAGQIPQESAAVNPLRETLPDVEIPRRYW